MNGKKNLKSDFAKYLAPMLKEARQTEQNFAASRLAKDCFDHVFEPGKNQAAPVFLLDAVDIIVAARLASNSGEEDFYINKQLKLEPAVTSLQTEKQQFHIKRSQAFNIKGSLYYLLRFETTERAAKALEELEEASKKISNIADLVWQHSKDYSFLMQALDSITDGISICDSEGKLLYVNNACCEIMGVKKEDFINQQIDFLTKDKPMLSRIIGRGKSMIDVDYLIRLKDKTVHLINSGYPVFDSTGDVIGAIDIFRNIEHTRELADRLAGYHAVFSFDDIAGESKEIKETINLAKAFAASDENVLITGESGTGKELLAQAIHNYSERNAKPFVALNCANFPNELIDSELFGYDEGAFTGAKKSGKPGKFELADGGTIFLDEIGEMQLHLQSKLLRVLETRCIERIAGNRLIRIDVRIITATNRDLEALMKAGKFRKDLYYRLKVLHLEVPPLKERQGDILLLAEYFVRKLAPKMNKNIQGIRNCAKEILLKHSWSGNIRELENVISMSLFICEDTFLDKKSLIRAGLTKEGSKEEQQIRMPAKISEKILRDAMEKTKGNKKKTAELLGISRPTLYKLLKNINLG